ncbi:MAG: hypothetical protein ABIP53_06105 [Candidatus Limnocylindrales bacterium]
MLATAGLTQADLDGDLKATGTIAMWMAKSAVRLVGRAASTGADVTARFYRKIRPSSGAGVH